MSRFFDGYGKTMQDGGRGFPGEDEFRQEFPDLWAALQGDPGEDGKARMPPCTLMIFAEGGRLKFCLSPKQGNRVCFGVMSDPVKGLWSVQDALAEGKFEWKVTKSR